MEAAAYIAGEPWTDSPECVCPVIAVFMRSWNDDIGSSRLRNHLLKPLLPEVVGTRVRNPTSLVLHARQNLVVKWVYGQYLPAWLSLVPRLKPYATRLTDFVVSGSGPENASLHLLRDIQDIIIDNFPTSFKGMSIHHTDLIRTTAGVAARNAANWGDANLILLHGSLWLTLSRVVGIVFDQTLDEDSTAMLFPTESTLLPTVQSLQESAVGLIKQMAALK
jgi:hypothetical protein